MVCEADDCALWIEGVMVLSFWRLGLGLGRGWRWWGLFTLSLFLFTGLVGIRQPGDKSIIFLHILLLFIVMYTLYCLSTILGYDCPYSASSLCFIVKVRRQANSLARNRRCSKPPKENLCYVKGN